MSVIHKFALTGAGYEEIALASGAQILSVQAQGDEMFLWAIVDPKRPLENRKIWIFGTGMTLPDYVGNASPHRNGSRP